MSTQYRNKWSEKKGNILPSLLPEAARALQKQIAAKWNSERTDKDYENDVFYSPSDVDYASIEDVVKHSGAKTYAKNAAKYRASKAIKMAEFTKRLTLICPQTGIVSAVDVPAIPGFFLPYENPLSSLSNSRAIAQRGYSYLLSLDTQVLAGILLVIADDYNLFQYPVFANGTSKNALLRSAGKNELIKAILFIEEKIHSENYSILPRLSLIPADDSVQGTMEVRLHNWLSIIQKELEAPTVVFPSALKVQTGLQKAREERNIEAAAEKNARKALLSFNKSLEEAIKSCKTLYKDGLIDQKLRNLLISFLDKDIFATLDGPVKAKVCLKLSTFPIESRITDLIKVFQRETVSTDSVDALLDGPTVPAPQPVKLKTAFELQNSPEVIRQQNEALRAKRLADQHIRDIENLINRLLNVGQTNGQLLLTMDKSKTTGYDSILLNGEPIPEGRFQLAAIKEAFAKVRDYKEAPAYKEPVETVAYIGHPEQQTPSFGTDTAMTEIEAGVMVPTLLWNSLSDFQKRIHRRKLLLAQSK